MAGVPSAIVERQLGHFARADPRYGEGVRRALAGRPSTSAAQ
jgi:catalase